MTISLKTERHLFGSSGIRLPFCQELVRIALNLGLACGKKYGEVVVGRDTRTSSALLKDILVSGLLAGGAKVTDAGIVPTPTLAAALGTEELGIMVTASHNPPEYNGFKVLEADGSGAGAEKQKEIEMALQEENYRLVPWGDLGSPSIREVVEGHLDVILRNCYLQKRIKVVVDSCCGAASLVTPRVLSEMGCEVIPVNCNHSGYPPRGVEPTEANLLELSNTVREYGADVGIGHDIDADRMMIIDELGQFVPGDKLLIALAQESEARDIVTTLDASMVLEELGFRVTRTAIGDVHVSRELMHHGEFGGEPSGNWIFPEVSLCPDGIYAAARVASLTSKGKLSEQLDSIPGHPIIRGSIDSDNICLDELEKSLLSTGEGPVNDVCRTDGLKIIYSDSWILVRRSGTEPKVRITIEAYSDDQLRTLYQKVMESIESCRNGRLI